MTCDAVDCINLKCRLTNVCIDQPRLPFISSPPLAPASPRTIIGFTGLAGSGKSTAAKHLIQMHGFARGKFAGALKDMFRALLLYRRVDPTLIERMIDGDLKEVPSPALNGRTPRHAMQTLGTEWGRNCMDANLWVDTEIDATANQSRLVFDDVRFPNEAEAVLAAGGIIVHIERPGTGRIVAGHASEGQPLPFTFTFTNAGPVSELLSAVDGLVRNPAPERRFA
jgi:hypothetical protein